MARPRHTVSRGRHSLSGALLPLSQAAQSTSPPSAAPNVIVDKNALIAFASRCVAVTNTPIAIARPQSHRRCQGSINPSRLEGANAGSVYAAPSLLSRITPLPRCLGLDSGPGPSRSWGWRLRLQTSVRAAADQWAPFAVPERPRKRLERPEPLPDMPRTKDGLLGPFSRRQSSRKRRLQLPKANHEPLGKGEVRAYTSNEDVIHEARFQRPREHD